MEPDRISRRGADLLWGLAGNALLLCGTTVGFAVSFFSLYGGADSYFGGVNTVMSFYAETGAATLAGISLLMALISLAVWSCPRFRALAVGGAAAIWGLLAFCLWEDFKSGALFTAQTMANLFADRVGWSAPLGIAPPLTEAQALSCVQVFSLLALALLAMLLGGTIVGARRWRLTVLLTLPPLLPGLLSDVYPNWPAFLTLASCWCAMLLMDLCKRANSQGWGRLALAVLPAVGVVLALAFLLTPPEGYTRPQWARRAETALENFGSRRLSFLQDVKGPFQSAVTYVGAAEEVDLSGAGPLNFTGRTVLRVSGNYTGSALLRGSSLARYEDGVWLSLDEGVYSEYTSSLEALEPSYTGSPLLFPAFALTEWSGSYTIQVENTGASGSCVYAPYQILNQDWESAGVLPVEDAYLARKRGTWSHSLTFCPLPDGGTAARLASQFPSTDQAEPLYRSMAAQYYLDVPAELAEYMASLPYTPASSAVTSGVQDVNSFRLSAAYSAAEFLAEWCEYDPEAPAAPEGEDPVKWFLAGSQRGYCMHFASAAALLLRTVGVPTRYVSGFTAGLVDGETVNVPDYAAHAWVEIYLDGYGWYPVDVTPDYGNLSPAETDSPSPSVEPSQSPEGSSSVEPTPSENAAESRSPSETPQETPNGADGEDGSSLHGLWTALRWLLAAGLAAGLLWLGQALPKRVRAARLDDPNVNRAVLYGYRCLTRMKKWGGEVPRAALELAQRARFGGKPLREDQRAAMRRMVDGQRARLRDDLRPVQKWLFRYLWGWPDCKAHNKEDMGHDHP